MTASDILLYLAAALFIGVAFAWMRAFEKRPGPDAAALNQLARAGANLIRPHPIEFFLYFPTRDAADRAAERVKVFGLEPTVSAAANGNLWLVFATRTMVPAERELARLRKVFVAIAAAEQGEYDGWGAPVVK